MPDVNWDSHLGYDDSLDNECNHCDAVMPRGETRCYECGYDHEDRRFYCKCGEELDNDGYCPEEDCANSLENQMARKHVKSVLNRMGVRL